MQTLRTLEAGGQVPHFRVRTVDGGEAAYADLWQRKNLLLVLLPDEGLSGAGPYEAAMRERMPELIAHDTVVVITRDRVPGAPHPGVVVADRWGEVHFVSGGPPDRLPAPADLVEWLRYVQVQCPECQGEAR